MFIYIYQLILELSQNCHIFPIFETYLRMMVYILEFAVL